MSNNQIIRIRTLINGLMVAALLAGLIPPPMLTQLAQTMIPDSLEAVEETASKTVSMFSKATGVARAAIGNVATNGSATQSSTDAGGSPGRAIDGNTNGNYGAGSVTHTGNQANAWWHLDLGQVYDITTIRLWNRTDCCGDRLQNFHVFVSDVPFSSTNLNTTLNQAGVDSQQVTTQPNPSVELTFNRTGRYIRVQQAGTSVLSLAEVQVFAEVPENLALTGTASQSSIWDGCGGCGAHLGIDGNIHTSLSGANMIVTNADNMPWWQVDLGSVRSISDIIVYGRSDVPWTNQVIGAYVLVSDTPFTGGTNLAANRAEADFEHQLTATTETVPANLAGRYVRIHHSINTNLTLGEIQVLEGADPGAITGVAFQDMDTDGQLDSSEPGLAGIDVYAIDQNGTVTTTTTITGGSYAISPSAGLTGTVRIEFTLPTDGSLDHLEPTVAGRTTVQFVDVSSGATANIGFHDPSDFCDNDPLIAIACYENGNGVGNGNPALVSFSYSASGIPQSYGGGAENPRADADVQTLGSVWGAAYQSNTQHLYLASLLKRHVGFADGPGYVYVVDYSNAASAAPIGSFDLQGVAPVNGGSTIDLGTVCRSAACASDSGNTGIATDYTLDPGTNTANRDLDAFDQIGKVSYGNIDLANDTLWLVNLNQRALISVDVSGYTPSLNGPVPGTVNQYLLDNIGGPACTNGVFRPFALTVEANIGYLGGLCPDDLSAHILTFDPANPAGSLNNAVTFPLTYSREPFWANSYNGQQEASTWRTWISTWAETSSAANLGQFAPQPILSDIEIADDGHLTIGFMDRFGHQAGFNNYPAISGNNSLVSGYIAGDIAHICNVGGNYVLEGQAGCAESDNGSQPPDEGDGGNGNFGARGNDGLSNTGEFYYGDYFDGLNADQGDTANHLEVSTGGLGYFPGDNEVINTVYDPILIQSNGGQGTFTQGLHWYSAASGARTDGYMVVPQVGTRFFGKAAGLGEPQVICSAPPLEIGNRVWEDTDGDGVQDPGEPAITDVTVELYDSSNNLLGTATTDTNGNYLFSSGPGTNTASAIYDITGLTANTTGFEVRIPNAEGGSQQAALSGLFVTPANADADQRDSDGTLNGTTAIVAFDTGTAGANNHTYDFGFGTTQVPSIAMTKFVNTPLPLTAGLSVSFTIRITNTGSIAITSLPLTDTYDINYLTYDAVADASGPNPASDVTDDGSIEWTNVLIYESTNNQLDPNETMDIIVTFTAKTETTALPGGIECETAGTTYNIASALGMESCVEVPIDPPEPKLTLGDIIWHDINNNGTQDANEPGIDGVVVNLYEVTGGGTNFVMSATTTTTNTVSGFYQFNVDANTNYQVEVDASNFIPGGPLDGFVIANNQPNISGTTVATQTELNVTTNVDTLDFGYYCRFDLALDKKLALGQSATIQPGDDVRFTLTLYNQGVVTATNIIIADYIPAGFTLNDGNWNGGTVGPDGVSGTVTQTVNATLTPSGTVGSATSIDIVLTAGATLSGTYTNTAEIADFDSSVKDGSGGNLPDADSDPDSTDGNGVGESTALVDDEINADGKNGGDEDDHDPAVVTVVSAPVNPSLALDKRYNGMGDVRVGETISFTIRITNTGDVTITTLPLEDFFNNVFLTYQSANPAPDPVVGVEPNQLRWTNLLAADPNGLGIGEIVEVDVFFTTRADTTLLPNMAPCNHEGEVPNLASVNGADAGGTPVIPDADDEDCDSVPIRNPTAVTLSNRSVRQTSDGVLVRWTTEDESNIIGLYVWKSSGVEAEVRSGEMIVARKSGQSSGSSYEWLDSGTSLRQGDVYVLEIVKIDGSTERMVIDAMSGRNILLPLVAR
ncbi:MAG: SdrD B-like domain-containing protein [Chloroflexota bacterium]